MDMFVVSIVDGNRTGIADDSKMRNIKTRSFYKDRVLWIDLYLVGIIIEVTLYQYDGSPFVAAA